MADSSVIPTERERRQGFLALIGVQIFFGLSPVVRAWAPHVVTARAVVFWRIAVGAVVMGAAAFALHGRRAIPERRHLVRFIACALLGISLNMLLFLDGLDRSTPPNATLLMQLIPVFTYAIAVCFRIERFAIGRGLGIAFALAGAMVLILQRGADLGASEHRFGNLLMVANAASYSIYLVMARPLARHYPALVVMTWVFVFALPTLPLVASGIELAPAAASTNDWISVAYLVFGGTIGAYLLNAFALSRISSSTTAAYIFLQPLITCAADYLWLGHALQSGLLVAAALIFVGLALVLRRPKAIPQGLTS